MSLNKNIGDEAYNTETGVGDDDVSYSPEETEANSPEERSDQQRLADGDIEVDNGDDEVFIDPNASYATKKEEDVEEDDGEEEEEVKADDEKSEKKKKELNKPGKKEVNPEVEKLAKRYSQKRINKISREKFELRDENEKLRKELKELKGQVNEVSFAKKKAEHTMAKPQSTDFDDDEQYYEALGRWAAKDEIYEHEAQRPLEEEPSSEEVNQQSFENIRNKILTDGEDKYEDFGEIVLKTDGTVVITQDMVLAAGDSDNAADIFYYLGQHPEESHRIAGLRGNQIAREMGKIESMFLEENYDHKPGQDNEFVEKSKKKTSTKTKRVSSAPPPVKPIGGGGKQATDLNDAGIADYFAARGYDRSGMKIRNN